MRLAQKLLYAVLVWFAIAFIGYGLALRQTATTEIDNRTKNLNQAGNDTGGSDPRITRDGRITWSDLKGTEPTEGVKFKLAGSDDTFEITEAILVATGRAAEVAKYLHPGALVRVEARTQDLHVTQFTSNFGTVYQKNLLTVSDTARGEDTELHSAEGRGLGFIVFGILLIPLFFGVKFGWARYLERAPLPVAARKPKD